VAITWDERNRRRRDLVTPGRWRHPVSPRPKIPVPAAVLALAAAAGLAGSIATASLIIGRVDAYNSGAIYLRAGHPVRALLASDHYVIFVGCTQDITCPRLPSGVLSAAVVHGGVLAVIPDPSSDRLSEAAQPFRGELSFTVPGKETVCPYWHWLPFRAPPLCLRGKGAHVGLSQGRPAQSRRCQWYRS
jgi:hypothetical protein